jgi:predicted MFS family arabinose efflux permease
MGTASSVRGAGAASQARGAVTEGHTRDRATILSYGAVGAYAFWLYAFGPALALLRTELHFSYAVLGVYSALWSGGAAVVGLTFTWVSRRLGQRLALWWSVLGASAGAAVLVGARSVAGTMAGTALLGFAGTMVLTVSQSVLSDTHHERRDRAFIEANIGAAVCAVVAPLSLGLFQQTPLTWRGAMALPAAAFALLYLRYRGQVLPGQPGTGPRRARRRLPAACWLLALLVAAGIAVEFCVVYFGAELLSTDDGLAPDTAATAMAVFYAGILAGRAGGAGLTGRAGLAARLVWLSLALTAAGFAAFWLSHRPAIALTGLFVTGLGIANLYPLSLALTLQAAPGNTDAANARSQLLGGLTVIAAPFALGDLATHIGLSAAFTVEPVLLAASALLLATGTHLPGEREREHARAAPPHHGRGDIL